ncbi:MAG: DUF4331 family protein [Mycolicibacterium sp.]|uniref:DUF4331 family protein n=1 Tax=Mycolicibacterium sp. TaxID=2320850 RepID=UPI003D0ED90B
MSSTHFPGPRPDAPFGDPRLELCDLYAFQSPADPARSVLILTAGPQAGPLHPDAVYRLAIDHSGDLRNDIAFSFVFAPAVDETQTADVYLAVGAQAATVAAVGSQIFGGVAVSFGEVPTVVRSGEFTFAAGARSDPSGSNVLAIAVELPNGYLSASPTVRIWGRCSVLTDGEWIHADRVGHPLLTAVITTEDTRAEYRAGEPNRDRDRWIGSLIEVMARTGGYTRAEAIAAIEADATLPDVLTYDPSRPAKYPNGRALTDDVVGYRRAFLTKTPNPPAPLNPDLRREFPYLGPPH